MDLALLWLLHRPTAAALIQLLAQELPYAPGVALKRREKKIKNLIEKDRYRRSRCGAAEMNPASIHEDMGSIPGLTELWCRSQMQLRSLVAVAVVQAGSGSSDSIPSLGTSICHGCGPKKQNKINK